MLKLADFEQPHNLEAERALLGSLMLDSDLFTTISNYIHRDTFYNTTHQYIFEAILTLFTAQEPIDTISIMARLKALGHEVELSYVANLPDTVPLSSNIDYYAGIVSSDSKARKVMRKLIEGLNTVVMPGMTSESIDEIIFSVTSELLALTQITDGKGLLPVLEVHDKIEADIERKFHERLDNPDKPSIGGLHSGLVDLDALTNGFAPTEITILAARPSMGKAQPLHSKVLLSDGRWTTMGEIQLGDSLASVDGDTSIVTGIFPQGIRPIYSITLSDGRRVEADAEHIWKIQSSKWKEPRHVTTLKLLELNTKVRYKNRIQIVSHSGEFGKKKDIGVDPWLLGFLLGDGCLTQSGVKFSNPEKYIHDKIQLVTGLQVKRDTIDRCNYSILHDSNAGHRHLLRDELKKLGIMGLLSYDKHIPDIVFECDKTIRQQVLAGLLESDGWVEKFGTISFSSASEILANGVARLVESLGGRAHKWVKNSPKYTYKGESKIGRPAHILAIAMNGFDSFIQSPRLLANYRPRIRSELPSIQSVEYIGEKEAQCIMVSHPAHLYITNGYIVTHNTAASLKMATSCASIDKKPVAYFSVESGKDSIMYRIQSMLSGIDSRRLKNGQMTNDDFKRLAYAKGVISEMPLWIDDKGGASPNYIRNQIQRYNMTHPEPIALVVIDYLQIMNDDAKGKDFNRNNEVGRISKALKEIAKDFSCHIVILSQLSRAIEGRKDNKPVLSDLRESGNIEQDADIVMFIHRDSYYDRSLPDKTSAKIIVAKNRDGACDEVEVSFEAGTTLFGNLQSSVNSIIGGGR